MDPDAATAWFAPPLPFRPHTLTIRDDKTGREAAATRIPGEFVSLGNLSRLRGV
jgi:hypothetical protein